MGKTRENEPAERAKGQGGGPKGTSMGPLMRFLTNRIMDLAIFRFSLFFSSPPLSLIQNETDPAAALKSSNTSIAE